MGLNVKKMSSANRGPQQEPIEPGTYPARVVQVVDLGLQPQRPYKGEAKKPAHEVMITYELLDEFCLDEDGEEDREKPRWLSETFPLNPLTSDLAKSTKRYKALDPDENFDGDFTQLVELPCMVTVIQNAGKGDNAGKVYVNVAGVSAMRPKEAARAAGLVNPPKVFILDEPDTTILGSLPDWLQDKIKGNLNFKGSKLEAALEGLDEEEEEEAPKPAPKAKKAAKAAPEPAEEEEADDGEPW